MNSGSGKKSVEERLRAGAVLKAIQEGSREAVRMHKLMGNPIATNRDGRVVWIPPEEIQIDDSAATPPH